MYKLFFCIIMCVIHSCMFAQYSLTGKISTQPLAENITITINTLKKGSQTDSAGFFSLTGIPSGTYMVSIRSTGYRSWDSLITFHASVSLNINLPFEEKALEDVVIVSSSRNNSRLEDLPTKVEVLGAEEVKEENQIKPGNIASLLGDIAGIQIQPTNAATGNADIRIQGLQGKYTQILRDGMPLFGGYSGSFGILQIPPLDLKQIELVKGPASTLYGGGAIAGMLNLVSKEPILHKPEKSITINRSSLLENNLNVFFSERNKHAGYTLYAGSTQQNAVDVDKDGFSDVAKVGSIFVHPRFFLYPNTHSKILVGYTYNYEDRLGGDMQVVQQQKQDNLHRFFIGNISERNAINGIYENKLSSQSTFTVKGNINFNSRKISTADYGMHAAQTLWYSEVAYAHNTSKHKWVTGINFTGDRLAKKLPDSTLVPNESSETVGAFLQDDWKPIQQLTIQGGLRADYNNQYGWFILPRLNILYKPNQHISIRGGGGLGYKTPTLFSAELDERDYRWVAGYQQGIQAENSKGFNIDVNYTTHLGEWKLTANQSFFYSNIQHPITARYYYGIYPPNPVVILQGNENAPITSQGFETYLAASKEALEIYVGYVYTDAERAYFPAAIQLPLIAKHKFATVIAYEFNEHWRMGIESAYTGKQYLQDGTTTSPYFIGALMVRYSTGKFSWVLNGENLLDYRQNKNGSIVSQPFTNPRFQEIWAPIDGRVINLSMMIRW